MVMETTTTTTLTTEEAAAAGAIAGGIIGAAAIFVLIYYVLLVIASWKIFKKAGEPGWKSIIPFYNAYILFKIVNLKGWFWGILCASIAIIFVMAIDGTTETFQMSEEELNAYNWGEHPLTVVSLVIYAIVSLCGEIIYSYRTSKAFGHGIAFTIGLLILPPIFWLILGFDSSKYDKKAVGLATGKNSKDEED